MVQQCWFGPALFFGLVRLLGAGLAGGLFSRLRCLFCLGLTAPFCRSLFFRRCSFCLRFAAALCGGFFLRRCSFCLGFAAALCGGFFLSLFGLCGLGSLLGCSLFRGLLLGGLAGALCRHLEIKHAHGRQRDGDALLEAVERLLLGADSLVVDRAGTAERLVVAVQDLLVGAGVRCAQGVALAQDGVEVADHEDLLAVCILAQEGHDALSSGTIHWKPSQL